MPFVAFGALLALLPVYIRQEYRNPGRAARVALKTACSLLFLATAALALLRPSAGRGAAAGVFLLAFACALAGDVLLALPQERFFVPGLLAFFAAQCLYAAAFTLRLGLSPWDGLLFTAFAALTLGMLLGGPGMRLGKLAAPACAYGLALSAMAAKAVSGLYLECGARAAVAAAGALLFYASDVVLGLDKFGPRHPRCMAALNLAAYYAGQGLLALSLAL